MKAKRSTIGVLAGFVAILVAASLGVSAGAGTARSADTNIVGAGSSFAAPLFTAWYQYYNPKAGVNVSYNSVGSGAGIASITARTVDFGASDAPLSPDQFTNCKDCIQIPVLLGTTAVLYNLPGVAQQMKLTGPDHRRHLPRQDHTVGRCSDQGDQQWREAAEPEDHACVSLGWLGHELQLHRLPVEGELRVRLQGRQVDPAAVPARRRCAR